ncbi:hypothetical protein B0H13DRAFT_2330199 [Mycena leptocephala]|nr:hypothetical protein B0H13DRAFT_2330199 [Mycena leptocephala]
MDDEHEAFLGDAEANLTSAKHSDAGCPHPQHLWTRCSSKLDSSSDYKITYGDILMSVAVLLCVTTCGLLATHMAIVNPIFLIVFLMIWTAVTTTILIVLLCIGCPSKLDSTVTQVRVLCGLACSWIFFIPK